MSSGLLTPDARLRVFSDLGLVSPGAKLNTYVSGTPSTPLTTYSDVTLLVPNANPVVASTGGLFGPIYLTPGVAYKYVLTDAAGNAIWSQDPVTAAGFDSSALTNHGVLIGTGSGTINATSAGTAGQVLTSNGASADPTFQASAGVNNAVCQGRLTLTTLTPVTTADVLAATTLRFTPYSGNLIALYSGTVWALFTFAELSIAVPATTSQMYDVFVYDNAGTRTLELLAWTNDTTRATALVLQDGVLCKTGDLTRRYVGSFRTTTVSGQTEDSLLKRYVWNYYNRAPRLLRVTEATDSWTYSTATWRQANAAAGNQVDVVVGVADTPIDLRALALGTNAGGALVFYTGIGQDSTSAPAANAIGMIGNTASGSVLANQVTAALQMYPTVGRHFYAWLERGSTGTTTWYGDNGDATLAQAGLVGMILG